MQANSDNDKFCEAAEDQAGRLRRGPRAGRRVLIQQLKTRFFIDKDDDHSADSLNRR